MDLGSFGVSGVDGGVKAFKPKVCGLEGHKGTEVDVRATRVKML